MKIILWIAGLLLVSSLNVSATTIADPEDVVVVYVRNSSKESCQGEYSQLVGGLAKQSKVVTVFSECAYDSDGTPVSRQWQAHVEYLKY